MNKKSRAVALATALFLIFFSSAATARPGLGGVVTRGSATARPGGLVIDWNKAYAAAKKSSVSVSWDPAQNELSVSSKKFTHAVHLDDWEFTAALDFVLSNPDTRSLTLSVDRVGGAQNVSFSDSLANGTYTITTQLGSRMLTVNPLADWLVDADLDYASLVQAEPDPHALAALHKLAPVPTTRRLLATDATYQSLAQDLVVPPSTWPMIEFEVGSFASSKPVAWQTDFALAYLSPHGSVVDPDDAKAFIKPSTAKMPFVAFERAVESDASYQAEIKQALPTVDAAERYALSLAALSAYCPKHKSQCENWRSSSWVNSVPNPAAPTATMIPAQLQLEADWNATRMALWANETRADYLSWMHIDQLTAILNGLTTELPPTLPLSNSLRSGKDVAPIVDLLELELIVTLGATDPTTPSDDSSLLQGMNFWVQGLTAISSSKSLSKDEREMWQDHAMGPLHLVVRASAPPEGRHPKLAVEAENAKAPLAKACLQAAESDAKLAESSPKKRNAETWRAALSRWSDRCSPIVGERLDILGRYHYALGYHAKKAKDSVQVRDRKRMLGSIAVIMRQEGDQSGAKAIETLAAKL